MATAWKTFISAALQSRRGVYTSKRKVGILSKAVKTRGNRMRFMKPSALPFSTQTTMVTWIYTWSAVAVNGGQVHTVCRIAYTSTMERETLENLSIRFGQKHLVAAAWFLSTSIMTVMQTFLL